MYCKKSNCLLNFCLVFFRENILYQRVARQQLCKHGPTRNNGGTCIFYAMASHNIGVSCVLYYKISQTINTFFFAKKKKKQSDKAQNVLYKFRLLPYEPSQNPDIVCVLSGAIRGRRSSLGSVQTSIGCIVMSETITFLNM
jgi:hypothetical protein